MTAKKRVITVKEEVAPGQFKQVFHGEDKRYYDEGYTNLKNQVFGITISDVFKVIPIIVACVLVYTNNESFKANQLAVNKQMSGQLYDNAQAIGGIKEVLGNLNNYLSSKSGQMFKDGIPRGYLDDRTNPKQ